MNIPKIAAWAGIIVGLIIVFGFAKHFFSRKVPTIHQHHAAIALAELNRRTPKMVDENTRLDSAVAISGKSSRSTTRLSMNMRLRLTPWVGWRWKIMSSNKRVINKTRIFSRITLKCYSNLKTWTGF